MRLLKKIYIHLVYPLIAIYIRKERSYTFGGFNLTILPGVFHPQFFFSTKYLFKFIDEMPLAGKKCLEIGCGSGLLALLMLRKGGEVTAIDIQKKAILNTQKNYEKNMTQFKVAPSIIESDLFSGLGNTKFDFIIINPPYFFAPVSSENDLPWYCGENGEYFQKLFKDLHKHILTEAKTFMILADNCDIKKIQTIAHEHLCDLQLYSEKKIWWENNYIMSIKPHS